MKTLLLFLIVGTLLITRPSLAQEKCYRDKFGKVYCEKRQGVDLSRAGLEGIETANRTLESQERIRASQVARERELLEIQRLRKQQQTAQQGNSMAITCKLESFNTISCQDSTGRVKRYREIE